LSSLRKLSLLSSIWCTYFRAIKGFRIPVQSQSENKCLATCIWILKSRVLTDALSKIITSSLLLYFSSKSYKSWFTLIGNQISWLFWHSIYVCAY
jgi:hypothetical protein